VNADRGQRRVAVVDIGTNSTRLLVAELADGRVTAELERRTEVTRLGAGVDAGGALSPEAMERVFATLEQYRSAIESHRVDRAIAVLTSAVRDAANGEEFRQVVHDRFGLEAHILSGEEEAGLTFLGATSDRDPADARPTLVIDIGGGSTELVIGSGRQVDFHVSTQAGVVRQSERHIHGDPPAEGELEAVAQDVRAIISAAVPERCRGAVKHAIAVAGTPTSLAAIVQALDPYDSERVHGYVLNEDERAEILGRLRTMPRAERELVPGLHPARAPTILPGIVILGEVMALFGLEQVEVSEHDILRGSALGL
jgi:exopolyphosphatase / guanosine-5'-triphosphate,3'-diphosphate pyrophosphatase